MKTKEALITEILQVCVASNVMTTGDLFFSLAFCDQKELEKNSK